MSGRESNVDEALRLTALAHAIEQGTGRTLSAPAAALPVEGEPGGGVETSLALPPVAVEAVGVDAPVGRWLAEGPDSRAAVANIRERMETWLARRRPTDEFWYPLRREDVVLLVEVLAEDGASAPCPVQGVLA